MAECIEDVTALQIRSFIKRIPKAQINDKCVLRHESVDFFVKIVGHPMRVGNNIETRRKNLEI